MSGAFVIGSSVQWVSILEFTVNGLLLQALADRSNLPEGLRSLRGT